MNTQTQEALKIINGILNDHYDYPDEAIPDIVFHALNSCKEALESQDRLDEMQSITEKEYHE